MLTGHPDEAADHSVTLPPLHQVPFQACFHAYVFNVWTARGTYLVPEYCKPGGFLDTSSAPHLGGEQSYSFSRSLNMLLGDRKHKDTRDAKAKQGHSY